MSLNQNNRPANFKLITLILSSLLAVISIPAIAHNIETTKDVAATFHIEPNHNPKINQPTTAWFALTRKGGASIPLSQCNCNLLVYKTPRTDNAQPVIKPALIPLTVEKYQEIPAAKITFPEVGTYELEINGSAKDSSFSPFKLTYEVVVSL